MDSHLQVSVVSKVKHTIRFQSNIVNGGYNYLQIKYL